MITCTNGPVSTTATPVQILVGGSSCQCASYCASGASLTGDEEIFNVSIGTLNNTSSCSQTGGPTSTLSIYSNYAGIISAPNLAVNSSYTLDVTVGQCGTFAYSGGVTAYMDFNQNGSFSDPGEQVFVSPTTTFAIVGTLVSTVLTVPATASLGTTRMRVIAVENGTATAECATYNWGETEDYSVTITAPSTNSMNELENYFSLVFSESTISIYNQSGISKIQLVNMLGLVVSESYDSMTILFSNTEKGLYLLIFHDDKGIVFSKKINI